MTALSKDRIAQLVNDYIRKSVDQFDDPERFDMPDDLESLPGIMIVDDEKTLQGYIHGTLEEGRESLILEMGLGQCKTMRDIVESILERNGFPDIKPDSKEFRLLCHGGASYALYTFNMPMQWIIPLALVVTLVLFWIFGLKFALGAIFALIHDDNHLGWWYSPSSIRNSRLRFLRRCS